MQNHIKLFIGIASLCSSYAYSSTDPKPLTFLQSMAVGAAVGMGEVAFPGQPLSYIANRVMLGKPIEAQHAYKGGVANAAGIAPITAIQMGVNTQATRALTDAQEADLSTVQKLGIGFAAGATGAVVATPQESIPLYQQNYSVTAAQAARALKGAAWRGLAPTAMRDGIFCAGYQAAEPAMQTAARATLGDTPTAALAGSIAAGVATAVASQPFHVAKTLMQADPTRKHHTTTIGTAKYIVAQIGIHGLFKGGIARGTRVAVAVPLYAYYKDKLKKLIQQQSSIIWS